MRTSCRDRGQTNQANRKVALLARSTGRDASTSCTVTEGQGPWGAGDEFWLLSESLLSSFMRECISQGGIRALATRLKEEQRTNLTVDNDVELPYDVQPCPIEKVCRDSHPGVCKTEHAAVMPVIEDAVSVLHRFKSASVNTKTILLYS